MIIKRLLTHNFLLLLVVVYTLLVTYLSLAKLLVPEELHIEGSDKIGHFIAYFVFVCIWMFFLFYSSKVSKSFLGSVLFAVLLGVGYGILMEIAQATLTTYRSMDWKDALANTFGALLAALFVFVFRSKLERLKEMLK